LTCAEQAASVKALSSAVHDVRQLIVDQRKTNNSLNTSVCCPVYLLLASVICWSDLCKCCLWCIGWVCLLICRSIDCVIMINAVVTHEIQLFQPLSTSVWNNFVSARGNLLEIMSKLFKTFCAAHEYLPTCLMSLK